MGSAKGQTEDRVDVLRYDTAMVHRQTARPPSSSRLGGWGGVGVGGGGGGVDGEVKGPGWDGTENRFCTKWSGWGRDVAE